MLGRCDGGPRAIGVGVGGATDCQPIFTHGHMLLFICIRPSGGLYSRGTLVGLRACVLLLHPLPHIICACSKAGPGGHDDEGPHTSWHAGQIVHRTCGGGWEGGGSHRPRERVGWDVGGGGRHHEIVYEVIRVDARWEILYRPSKQQVHAFRIQNT